MKYKDKQGKMYLIYYYDHERNIWIIEDPYMTRRMMVFDTIDVEKFTRDNGLEEVTE